MATGLARGAAARGRKIALGDKRRIIWDKNSETIFRDNPNIARPGAERDANVQWIEYYKGHRLYNHQDRDRWIWNYDFKAQPGELFFDANEKRNGSRYGQGFVLIEPNVPVWKTVAPNKDWGRGKYQTLADNLRKAGHRVAQFRHEGPQQPPLEHVDQLKTFGFRDAVAILSHAAIYIGPEGGLHHAAAAVNRPAVVLFGGFIPPEVTGYETHTNLTSGAEACGSIRPCTHCRKAMAAILVDEVFDAAKGNL